MACFQRYHISQPRGKQDYLWDRTTATTKSRILMSNRNCFSLLDTHRTTHRAIYLAKDSTVTTRLRIMDHRPQLPHRGSSQISDLDVEFDVDCPPTPVLEGKHMARRELPLDLENCQEKNDLECETHDVPTQGYKSDPYPPLTPPAWTGLPSPPAKTKNFVAVATLYFCLREYSYFHAPRSAY